jgi:hypothetical protein
LVPFREFIYKNAVGKLKVTFQVDPGVTWISTNRETQKTAEGIHVGSPAPRAASSRPRRG